MKIDVLVASGLTVFNFYIAIKTGGAVALAIAIILLFFACVFCRMPDEEVEHKE